MFGDVSTYAPDGNIPYHPLIMMTGGLLVGMGTRIGSGCTSGHGICGIGRLSVRSIVATSTFFSVALMTTTLSQKYVPQFYNGFDNRNGDISKGLTSYVVPAITLAVLCGAIGAGVYRIGGEKIRVILPSMLCGFGFSSALAFSGMGNPSKIRGFLDLTPNEFKDHWDPTLLFVFCGGLGFALMTFPLILKRMNTTTPLFTNKWNIPTNKHIDKKLLVGNTMFGIGWGLTGICPGPGLLLITSNEYSQIGWYFMIPMLIGMKIYSPIARIL